MRIVSFGELLWDVIDGREFLGGAPVNFAAASLRLGADVELITAVGDDARGARSITAVRSLGLTTRHIRTVTDHPTGIARVVSGASGHARYEFNRPAAYDFLDAAPADLAAPGWIYFGTLAQTSTRNEAALSHLMEAFPAARRFYDINLREGQWNFDLAERLSARASILKLNETEAETLFHCARLAGAYSLEAFCAAWSRSHGINTICVTLGAEGCAVWSLGALRRFPGFAIQVADTVGAGDAFAAAFLHGIERGWPIERTAAFANALGAIVASRPGATPDWSIEECEALAQSSHNR